jgi:hypothetical protein
LDKAPGLGLCHRRARIPKIEFKKNRKAQLQISITFSKPTSFVTLFTKYTTVHIPNVLAILINKLIDSGEFAYSSRSEFVKDALRRFLGYHGYYLPLSISMENPK